MENANNKGLGGGVRLPLIIVSVASVFALMLLIALKTDTAVAAISAGMSGTMKYLGPVLEISGMLIFVFCLFVAFSKYGKIKLGEGKPEYSLFTYCAMMFMASMASAAIYWSFTEWVYYYLYPGLTFEAESREALESALAYQFFHWGPGNMIYVATAFGLAYAYYIRKVPILQLRTTCNAMLGNTPGKSCILSVIDFISIFAAVGGMGVTLGAAIPLMTGALSSLFGLETTLATRIGVIVFVTCVFTFTSFIGTKRGMARLSTWTGYICIAFLLYVLFAGPTSFILKNTSNSLGWMLAEMPRMFLFTDPLEQSGGFPESWTIFFIAFFTSYTGFMAIFMAKISKGRTLRQFVLSALGGMWGGTIFLFGTLGSFSIDTFLTKKVDVVELTIGGVTGEEGIYQILQTLPGGAIIPVVIFVIITGFVASSLDTASLGLSQITTKKVDNEGNVNPLLRVFWCIIIALVPTALVASETGFGPIKNLAILVAIPFFAVVLFIIIRFVQWAREDMKNGVLEANLKMAEEEKAIWESEELAARRSKQDN